MLNNLMMHYSGYKKNKILLQIHSSYFSKIVSHYSTLLPFTCSKSTIETLEGVDIPSTHEESRFQTVVGFNLQGMRYKCSYLMSLNSSLACEIDYLQKSCRLQFCILNFCNPHLHKFQKTLWYSKGTFRTLIAPILGFL